jgi:hypothetical protein
LVSETGVNTFNLQKVSNVSLQSGLMLSYSLNEKLRLRTFAALRFEDIEKVQDFSSYEFIYNISNIVSWHFGVMATPITQLRPNPTTWESQVETNAQSKIIGGRPGTKINFRLTPDLKIAYGIFNHDGVWANHLKVDYKFIKVAGYFEKNKSFYSLNVRTRNINSTMAFEPNEQLSNSIFVDFKENYSLLLEFEYSIKKNKVDYGNIGLRKYFIGSKKWLKGYFSVEYSPLSEKQITGSFFIHI